MSLDKKLRTSVLALGLGALGACSTPGTKYGISTNEEFSNQIPEIAEQKATDMGRMYRALAAAKEDGKLTGSNCDAAIIDAYMFNQQVSDVACQVAYDAIILYMGKRIYDHNHRGGNPSNGGGNGGESPYGPGNKGGEEAPFIQP